MCVVAVVAAGVDGLAATIAAAEQAKTAGTLRIVLLVGAKMIGAKILVSDDGRCNIMHEVVTPHRLLRQSPHDYERHDYMLDTSALIDPASLKPVQILWGGLGRTEGRLPPRRHTVEQILATLCEAEVALS